MLVLQRVFARDRLWILLPLILSACVGQTQAVQTSTPILQSATSDVLVQATSTVFETQVTEVPASTIPAPTGQPEITTTAAARLFNGIQQGFTETGFPYLGSSEAPMTLIDYSDFL